MDNKQYQECYIAFLDLLGFKNITKTKKCHEIISIFEKIKKPYDGIDIAYMTSKSGYKTIIDEETVNALKIKVMSDSICFYIDAAMKNALLNLIFSCILFQQSLLELSPPILLRGAIVRGELYAEGDVTFGPGLTEAYLEEEKKAKFPRIIIDNTVLEYARQDNISNNDILEKIDQELVFLDFDKFYTLNFIGNDKTACENLKKDVHQVLNSTKDESIYCKYLYLKGVLERHSKEQSEGNF